jgi:hypothetical protein
MNAACVIYAISEYVTACHNVMSSLSRIKNALYNLCAKDVRIKVKRRGLL